MMKPVVADASGGLTTVSRWSSSYNHAARVTQPHQLVVLTGSEREGDSPYPHPQSNSDIPRPSPRETPSLSPNR